MARIFLALAALIAVELVVFRLWADAVGHAWAWGLMGLSGLAGLWLIYRGLSFAAARRAQQLGLRELLLEPTGSLIAGLCLLVPGLVSDLIGLLLLLPPLRHRAALFVLRRLGGASFDGSRLRQEFRSGPSEAARGAADPAPDGSRNGRGKSSQENELWPEHGAPDPALVRDVAFEVLEKSPDADRTEPHAS